MTRLFLFFIVLCMSLLSVMAEPILDTPQVIAIVSSSATESVNIFNDGSDITFTATLEKNSPAFSLVSSTLHVPAQSYGSFSLDIHGDVVSPGVYFDTLRIFSESALLFEIPLIAVVQDLPRSLPFAVSLDFDPATDVSTISSESVLTIPLTVYKLDYNSRSLDNVVLRSFIYTLGGELVDSSEEVISVSGQATFKRFFNLGEDPATGYILVASVEYDGQVGFDIQHISIAPEEVSLSPRGRDYSSWVYFIIFVFLLASMIGLSHFWHHRSVTQAKGWKQQLHYIKKTQFSNAARALRKLSHQREVLERAYTNHYISKESYAQGVGEINRLSSQLKKRL